MKARSMPLKIFFEAAPRKDMIFLLCTDYLMHYILQPISAIPPKFVSKFEPKYYFFKRHDHELMCDVTGGPPPVKVWYKGSTVLPAGKNSDGVIAKASGELEFKAAKVEMEGDYKCVATNVADSAEDGTSIRVVGKKMQHC